MLVGRGVDRDAVEEERAARDQGDRENLAVGVVRVARAEGGLDAAVRVPGGVERPRRRRRTQRVLVHPVVGGEGLLEQPLPLHPRRRDNPALPARREALGDGAVDLGVVDDAARLVAEERGLVEAGEGQHEAAATLAAAGCGAHADEHREPVGAPQLDLLRRLSQYHRREARRDGDVARAEPQHLARERQVGGDDERDRPLPRRERRERHRQRRV